MWVEHLDKGRLELNFVIPKVHLPTGKQLNVYQHKADMPLIKSFRQMTNAKSGWSDPDEHQRARATVAHGGIMCRKTIKVFRAQINSLLEGLVGDGLIRDRSGIISLLEESGFKLSNQGKKTITTINESNPDPKQNKVCMRGKVYGKDFKISERSEAEERESQARFESYRDSRIAIRLRWRKKHNSVRGYN